MLAHIFCSRNQNIYFSIKNKFFIMSPIACPNVVHSATQRILVQTVPVVLNKIIINDSQIEWIICILYLSLVYTKKNVNEFDISFLMGISLLLLYNSVLMFGIRIYVYISTYRKLNNLLI